MDEWRMPCHLCKYTGENSVGPMTLGKARKLDMESLFDVYCLPLIRFWLDCTLHSEKHYPYKNTSEHYMIIFMFASIIPISKSKKKNKKKV